MSKLVEVILKCVNDAPFLVAEVEEKRTLSFVRSGNQSWVDAIREPRDAPAGRGSGDQSRSASEKCLKNLRILQATVGE